MRAIRKRAPITAFYNNRASGPWYLVPHPQHPLEGLPELGVEDGVDDGVHAWVDVPQEGGGEEGDLAGGRLDVELDADGVQDVAREEGDPTDEEAGWNVKIT